MTTNVDDGLEEASLIGRHLGRYTCVRELGAGGMAVVYLARRTGAKGFTKVFALKRIKQKYAADSNFTRMFMREANLSASLDHPNIAQVIDFGQDGREYFLVMEYVHGPDLRQLLRASKGGRLPLPCALLVLTRLCAALHYAHEKTKPDGSALGLVHRDVSPTNVLLSMDGAIKLTDFGIAKGFGDASGTSSGLLVGKPGYMSPEQVRCETLNRRSDVFSLGILLYETTTGHRCFFGDNVFAVLNATQRASFVAPSERDSEYPPVLEAIVNKALAADANERYASARELQLALEEFALDQRIRVSDTALCDYLAHADIELQDPNTLDLAGTPSGTDVHDAGGTAFMLSGGVAAETLTPAGRANKASSKLGYWVAGAVLLVGAGVGINSYDSPATAEIKPETASTPPRATPVNAPPTATPLPTVPAPQHAAPVVVAAEPEPKPEPRSKRNKKRRKSRASGKGARKGSDLDALAPPSRRSN